MKGLCPVLDALTHHHPDQSQHSWSFSNISAGRDRTCLFLSCVGIFSLLPNKLEEQRMGGSHSCPCQSPQAKATPHQDEVQEETGPCLFLSCVGIFSLLPNKLEEQRMGGSHSCPCQSPQGQGHTLIKMKCKGQPESEGSMPGP